MIDVMLPVSTPGDIQERLFELLEESEHHLIPSKAALKDRKRTLKNRLPTSIPNVTFEKLTTKGELLSWASRNTVDTNKTPTVNTYPTTK